MKQIRLPKSGNIGEDHCAMCEKKLAAGEGFRADDNNYCSESCAKEDVGHLPEIEIIRVEFTE